MLEKIQIRCVRDGGVEVIAEFDTAEVFDVRFPTSRGVLTCSLRSPGCPSRGDPGDWVLDVRSDSQLIVRPLGSNCVAVEEDDA